MLSCVFLFVLNTYCRLMLVVVDVGVCVSLFVVCGCALVVVVRV